MMLKVRRAARQPVPEQMPATPPDQELQDVA
jgi:hypothetical protein